MTFKNSFNILFKSPATLALHIALCVIVAGALITHFTGISGKVTLTEGAAPTGWFECDGGGTGMFPFRVSLTGTEISYYPDTSSPSDFASDLSVEMPDGEVRHGRVAMNRVYECDGWRFYQTAISPGSSTLTVSHDPVGIAVTYTGYVSLGIAMLLFLLTRATGWRAAVRRVAAVVAFSVCCVPGMQAGDAPVTIQRPLAREMGKLLIYHDGRVRPLSAFAIDFTRAVYGSDSYRGLTPEQVLAGWLFYYDSWKREPMIAVKGRSVREAIGVDGKYASLHDFYSPQGYRLEELLHDRTDRNAIDADARVALLSTVATGAAFQLFPYRGVSGVTEWISWGSRRPSAMSDEQWELISGTLPELNMWLAKGLNVNADSVFKRIGEYQMRFMAAGGTDVGRVMRQCRVERWYMRYARLFPVAGVMIVLGFFGVVLEASGFSRWRRRAALAVGAVAGAGFLYVSALLAARWYVTGHLPMASGHETMLTMCAISLAGSLCACRRLPVVGVALLLVAGLSLLVAAMGGNSPQMGPLLPVLASPWLSVHVMLVMTSYALSALMTVIAVTALCMGENGERRRMTALNGAFLLPMVFLLAAGIFVGAVWANQSWGRYWGWDPKETCALVTMLIYALPLHRRSLAVFRRPMVFNLYLAFAFIAVLFTYFGANYLLPGLHSYA